jgi:ferritin-like metal-binding protein YciE
MLDSLTSVLEDQIKDLYSAETQLVKALPKMAKGASSDALRQAFTSHLAETKTHVERLERAASILGMKGRKTCAGMKGLIEEGNEVLKENEEGEARDVALIAAAQRVEHYEIAAYGTVRTLAEQLGNSQLVKLFEATLDEEKHADETLTEVCMEEVMPAVSTEAGN